MIWSMILKLPRTYIVLEELVEQCKRDSDLQVLEVAPDFVAEEVKDVDFVKLNDEGMYR